MNWQMATLHLKVHGMSCNGCVAAVRNTLKQIPGVENAEVYLDAGRAEVTYDPAQSSAEAMTTALGQLGYTAEVENTAVEG